MLSLFLIPYWALLSRLQQCDTAAALRQVEEYLGVTRSQQIPRPTLDL